ncbi:hypothetical protein SLEP1_g16910 [Rubroshorea leprosula]|uniref:Phospholipid/glycerol acyltransferase domain-containing protein n=1 Tax=Rubroshorea leprosula TaxID=152421 RepID=A0AAV5J004_9ROSI|nr:hypothetical protein SLEP1_g16910 [Rubroshorea leprosula]
MTLWGYLVSSDDLSGFVGFWVPFRSGDPQLSCRSWEVLAVFPILATVGLDLCRGVLEILCHPLRSSLKGVPWLDQSTSGCSSDFTSLPPMASHAVWQFLNEPSHENASAKDDRPLLKHESPMPVSTETIQEVEKKCAAYVRNDVYGPMGRGELPLKEKLLLVIALLTLLPIRIILAMTILVLYYLICRICTLFSMPNREDEQGDSAHLRGWRRAVIVHSGRFLARLMLFVFGFYWISSDDKSTSENQSQDQSEEVERPGAIICNHVSYIDILYHMSSSFSSFVANRSVAKLPFVGLISKCLGCIFVQRESKSSDFKGVSGVVAERVREAHQNKIAPMMMLFPEGTITNGSYLLPFKTGAFLARVPVLPVILRYPYQRFSPAWDSISGASIF